MPKQCHGLESLVLGFPQPKKPLCFVGVAGVAKLADAPDLGSGAARRGGSSPFTRTNKKGSEKSEPFFYTCATSRARPANHLALFDLNGVGLVIDFYLVRTALYHFG